MKKETDNEFYIGYAPEMPPRIGAFVRKTVMAVALLVTTLAACFVLNEKGFVNSTNGLLQQTQLEGVIYKSPAPMIKVFLEDSAYQSILFTGYGKFGAEETIVAFENEIGGNIEHYRVMVKGGMVYYDGRAIMQLNPGTASLLAYEKITTPLPVRTAELLGTVTLAGEIVDSKCFFGAMNPGYGKVHLSCAVRCISGGIPPVLVVKDENGFSDYFLIRGKEGTPVNQDLLTKTDVPVQVKGSLEKIDDWFILRVDAISDVQPLAAHRLDASVQLCASYSRIK